jgi:hypothetical protein
MEGTQEGMNPVAFFFSRGEALLKCVGRNLQGNMLIFRREWEKGVGVSC